MSIQPSISIPFPTLPEGTVTFLFTDIEGPTHLLQQMREGYAVLLDDPRLVVTGAETAEVIRRRFQKWMASDRSLRAWQERLLVQPQIKSDFVNNIELPESYTTVDTNGCFLWPGIANLIRLSAEQSWEEIMDLYTIAAAMKRPVYITIILAMILSMSAAGGVREATAQGLKDGQIRLFLQDQDHKLAILQAEDLNPRFTVFPEWEWYDGVDWQPGVEVSINVVGKPECTTTGVSDEDYFFNGPFPDGCDIQTEDVIIFSDEFISRTHTVENLTVILADSATDTITGIADQGKEILVWPHATGEVLTAITGIDGLWKVTFAGVFDLVPGASGRAQIVDVQGNGTAYDWTVPKPFMIAFPEFDAVEAWDWPVGSEVTLTIDNAPVLEWTGIAEVTEWGEPSTYIRFEFHDDYDLQIGDTVTLTSASLEHSHTVLNLSITSIDDLADTITGTTDANTLIQARLHGYDNLDVWSDDEGNWTADFTPMDLAPGMGGRVERMDENGHLTAVDWSIGPPSFRDDFDGEELNPGWYWSSEDSEGSLEDGWLHIWAAPNFTGEKNLLLRSVMNSDFTIKTHLIFEPTQNYSFAGLVIYSSEGNYVQLGRAYCGDEWCAGNAIYFDDWVSGSFFVTPVDSPNEAYLRLERRGEMVRAFYSADGFSWVEIGTHWISPDFDITGVGLTASQNYEEENAQAHFDFFELNEGWDFLPEGFHDYNGGDVPAWACSAGGWAADPDDRGAHLNVEIVVDDHTLETLAADGFRPDLQDAGVCEGGECSFEIGLWDRISNYEEHTIIIWAQDTQTGDWVRLSNSPKPLNCRTYDIYAFDPVTSAVTQVSNIRNADEYNPSWSPNGKKVVHDTWYPDLGQSEIYITDVNTGASTKLSGALGGNDAAWSPNGKWIVFDRVPMGQYNLYLLPATGGTSQLVREDAVSADWVPSGKRLVFQQPSDESILTLPIDGGKGGITFLDYGANPSWSPNGDWIAYERDGKIWKVAVNALGRKLGEPILMVDMLLDAGQPTWSPDSQTIMFHAGLDRFYDLWSVPAVGGEPVWLNGVPDFGDYDPAYAKNSARSAYASVSPSGQAKRLWVQTYTYDFPKGAWTEGEHQYHIKDNLGHIAPDVPFTVSLEAPSYEGFVLLRPFALVANTGEGCEWITSIHTNQPTRTHAGWLNEFPSPFSEAIDYFSTLDAWIVPDGGEPVPMAPQTMMPYFAEIWWELICRSTAP
jgi:regulation of enolase protein 1 (concanavalin A-like superfamily)